MRIILAIFFSICFLTMYIYAIPLLFGIGGKALAGYHCSQSETTAGKEHKYILRRAGICLLVITMLSHAMRSFFYFWNVYIRRSYGCTFNHSVRIKCLSVKQ